MRYSKEKALCNARVKFKLLLYIWHEGIVLVMDDNRDITINHLITSALLYVDQSLSASNLAPCSNFMKVQSKTIGVLVLLKLLIQAYFLYF